MELNENQLQQLHNHLISLLKIFDNFCRENKFRYYLLGGSALGAIRHNGIIPWDDDIDIGMPREDYDRFLKLFPKNGIEQAVLKTNRTNREDHVYPWTKIEDSSTRLVVDWHKHLNPHTGVFIDLFPLDGVPYNSVLRRIHVGLIQKLRFFLTVTYVKGKNRGKVKGVLCRLVQNNVIRFLIERFNTILLKMYPFDSSLFVGNPMGEYGLKEVMHKEVYGRPREVNFGDQKSFVPAETELYLTNLYGPDWAQLPSKEKRKSAHNFSHLSFE